MSFQPVIPLSGYAGWQFLKRTQAAQQASLANSAQLKRETAYFAERIGSVRSSDDLLGDRRLLSVALGAYGLEADINSRAFLKKVLDEGTLAPDAFANRLADKRYLALARAFGADGTASSEGGAATLAQDTTARYLRQRFEVAVGETSPDLRLALEVERGIATILEAQTTDNARWYGVMANQGLRKVIESALGLPHSLGAIDVDRQLDSFRGAAKRVLGVDNFAQLATPEAQDRLVRLFLLRSATSQPAATSALGIRPLPWPQRI